jgi:hypothetical protein
MMEQILERLLAEMNAMEERTEMKQERMEVKIGAEIQEKVDTFQEKMDDGQEEMKGQVGSLTSWISANREERKAMFNACLEKMEANP